MSKEHELLTDLLRSSKAIRKNNFVPTSEVDLHIGIEGICKAIESGNWVYKREPLGFEEEIGLYKFFQYLAFINSAVMVYNTVEDDVAEKNAKEWQSTVIIDFYDTLDRILKNDITKPKFV